MIYAILVGAGILVLFLGLFWIRKEMRQSFQALSFEVLERAQRSFLDVAAGSLAKHHSEIQGEIAGRQKALQEILQELSSHQRELERKREGAYAALSEQVEGMRKAENDLRKETASLAASLQASHVRGNWGEMHLRRVLELTGLLSQCDFFLQKTLEEQGRVLRPDVVIRLSGGTHIAIDAKTPLHAYLEAHEVEEESLQKKKREEHALSLRKHMKELSSKEYWRALSLSPDYVILFLPAEGFLRAALEVDPSLIEYGAEQKIVLATPSTLIAILRTVAWGWKQEKLSQNAEEMARLGHELYDRIGTLVEHWGKVGRQLNGAVEAYNQTLASLDSRVLVSARKLQAAGSFSKEIEEPAPIYSTAKTK